MNVFGIGLPEMAVIAAIGLLVFGPKRLPELGKTLGRTIRGFQSASQEFEKEFRSAVDPLTAPADGAVQTATADVATGSGSGPTLSPAIAAAAPVSLAPADAAGQDVSVDTFASPAPSQGSPS
jgi:sec-independent protein translocase protein TatA